MEKNATKPANSGGMRMGDGDWVCSDFDCGNVNFSRRTSCNRCGKERAELKLKKKMGTEIGKSAADKSRGLFSADDWQCNKCANVNWARRQTCNVCNAPKFGEVEARTGYGGGYNERGTVEYRPRRDSDDDEYDEFGRRKKKKSSSEQPEKVMSIQRVPSFNASSHQGDAPTYQHSSYKKPTVVIAEDQRIPKSLEHNSDRSADYVRESRYSRSSENSSDLLKRPTTNRISSKVLKDDVPDRHLRVSDWSSKKSKSNLSSPRDCIMENRVSSTNEIKYRFTGKTIDDNFEVVYTLEERICAAAWAITYMNCRISAEQFQNTFDKPAPDFKTIFAWRQRLLSTGCLVDKHILAESPNFKGPHEQMRIRRKLGRRKRARYYDQRGDTTESSSDDRPNDVFKRKVVSSRSSKSDNKVIMLEMSSHDDTQVGQQENKHKSGSDESEETNSGSKDNRSIEKRDSSSKPINEYDSYLTDPTRSMTPEFTNLRMDLANVVKTPQRKAMDDKVFAEDIYFDDDALKSKSHEDVSIKESCFLIPDIPKHKNTAVTPKSVEDSLKSVLEDIISESERYSSDDGSECDLKAKEYMSDKTDKNQKLKSPYKRNDGRSDASSSDLRYKPSCSTMQPQILDLPLPKFVEQTSNSNNFESSLNTTLQGCAKNMSLAMRRIYQSMTSQSKGSDGDSGLEYIPTKINPAMAKNNHQLFDDVAAENDMTHDIFSDNSVSLCDGHLPSTIPAINSSFSLPDEVSEKKSKNVFQIQMFEDYIPEDDALYKDGSSESCSDKNEDVLSVKSQKDCDTITVPTTKDTRMFESVSNLNTFANKSLQNEESSIADKVVGPVEEPCQILNTESDSNVLISLPEKKTAKIVEQVNQPKATNETLKMDGNMLASLLNINFSAINAEDLAKTLKQIQVLAEVVQQKTQTSEKLEDQSDKPNKEIDETNVDNTIVIDDNENDEPVPHPNIPFLSDMFDPGTPPNSNAEINNTNEKQTEKVTDLSNVQETNLDDLLDLLPIRPVSCFKSFAIPKPIMLNRLKGMNPVNEDKKGVRGKTTGRKKKKLKSDDTEASKVEANNEEEDEESGDDEDLSKYDLWGDEEPSKERTEPEVATPNIEVPAEKRNTEKAPSPLHNNDDKRSRGSKKSSGSTSRSSSSSSSSSDSSSGAVPRNRYDDFNLNSELSRAESADSSRSRSNSRERKHSSRNDRQKHKRSTTDRRDRHPRISHHSGRVKHRKESDRRHHNSHRHRR